MLVSVLVLVMDLILVLVFLLVSVFLLAFVFRGSRCIRASSANMCIVRGRDPKSAESVHSARALAQTCALSEEARQSQQSTYTLQGRSPCKPGTKAFKTCDEDKKGMRRGYLVA